MKAIKSTVLVGSVVLTMFVSAAYAYCGSSDTCFEIVSTSGDETTIRCTEGNNAGQTKVIYGPNENGKYAYALGGYHRDFREAGNFACS